MGVDEIREEHEKENDEDQIVEVTVDSKEILDSVKLKDKEVDVKPIDPKELDEDENLTKELYAEFNDFLKTKSDIVEDKGVKAIIPTGIDLLDTILGGGFPVGALSIIVGQPGSGKSMLAFQALGNGQKHFKGKLLGGVLDTEYAATTERLANLGVRMPRIKPYTDITVEKVFQYLEGVCLFKDKKGIIDVPSMAIWDSIANTLCQKELEAEDPNSVIGYKARLLSLLIPKYVSKCAKFNICLIAVNQLRDKLQMGVFQQPKDLKFMSSNKDMPGGNILKFNAFHLLEMKTAQVLDPEKFGFDGVLVKVKCVKNKLFTPNIEIDIVGSFTTGFSNFWTNYVMLANHKRLQTGAWNYLIDVPDMKFRTKQAKEKYNTDENFRAAFDLAVQETLDKEYIMKYSQDFD